MSKDDLHPPAFEKLGIGIQLTDGTIIDKNDPAMKASYQRSEVIGITFEKGHVSCVICPDAVEKKFFCNGTSTSVTSVTWPSLVIAESYYSYGHESVQLKGALTADQNWAVNHAYAKILNGQHCYIPDESELVRILAEHETIDALLANIGCDPLPDDWYWSSSLVSRKDKTTGEQTLDFKGYLYYMFGCTKSGQKDGINVQGFYNVLPIAPIVK